MKSKNLKKRLFAIVFAIIFAVGLLPLQFAQTSTKAEEAPALAFEQVDWGTPGVDYVDGEVIAIVSGGEEALLSEIQGSAICEGSEIEENLGSIDYDAVDESTGKKAPVISVVKKMLEALMPGYDFGLDYEILVLSGDNTEEMIAYLETLDCVMAVQPNYYFETTGVETVEEGAETNALAGAVVQAAEKAQPAAEKTQADPTKEPFFKYQWGLNNTIDTNGQAYVDVNMKKAWEVGAGSEGEDIVVAVIDTGVDYNHEELKNVMWSDGTQYEALTALGGGKYGINFAPEEGEDLTDPMDRYSGHGTHCASVIAAEWNGKGIAGISNKVKIMAVRALSGSPTVACVSASLIKAYQYVITAKQNGVNVCVTSNSYGPGKTWSSREPVFDAMITSAGKNGIISVFSSGNSGFNNDLETNYSLSNSPYTLTVGALNSEGNSADFSQYGRKTVDVYAPGTRILAATSSYVNKKGQPVDMDPEFMPWTTYDLAEQDIPPANVIFMDSYEESAPVRQTAEIEICRIKDDGSVETVNTPMVYKEGGYYSDKRLSIDVSSLDTGSKYAIYINVPSEVVKTIDPTLSKLYVAGLGGFENCGDGNAFYLQAYTQNGWVEHPSAGIVYDDGNWYNFSASYAPSSITAEELLDDQGRLQFRLVGQFHQITESSKIYLDNISLGVADSVYYYSDGTSMSCPFVSGIVSTLCSYAASNTETTQTEQQAKDIVAFIKGSVLIHDSVSEKCETKGVVNAYGAYAYYKEYLDEGTGLNLVVPVIDDVTVSGSYATLHGHFFGTSKGTLTFGGKELNVSDGSWFDDHIIFKVPVSNNVCQEFVVTRADSIDGRSFLTMPAPKKGFEELTAPEGIEVNGASGSLDISQLVPLNMVSTKNALFVYAITNEQKMGCILRYDLNEKTWSVIDFPEGVQLDDLIEVDLAGRMAGGEDQLYIAVDTTDVSAPAKLLTYDDTNKEWKYRVDIIPEMSRVALSPLAIVDGKLFQWVLGSMAANTCMMYNIYPNNGAFYENTDFDPTVFPDYIGGFLSQTNTGITYLGALAGANPVILDNPVNAPRRDAVNYNSSTGNVSSSDKGFFNDGNGSLYYDEKQLSNAAFGAVDTGFIVTGPIKNNQSDSTIDTWIYNASEDTWQPVTNALFNSTRCHNITGCTANGKFYVLGINPETKKLIFASLDLEKVGLTDSISTANKKNAPCGYEVTIDTCQHGSVSIGTDERFFAEGSEITITATPESEDYELDEFYAYKTGDPDTVVQITDGKLKTPDFNITIGARFKDKDAPVISGIENGATYYTTQKFTVSDATSGIKDVKVNDTVVTDYTLEGNKAETYIVRATDNTGNYTEISVTMKPVDSLFDPIKDLNANNVMPEDKQDIQNVKTAISNVDVTNATQAEKNALSSLTQKCEDLLTVIAGYENPYIIEGAGTIVDFTDLKDATFKSSSPSAQFAKVLVDNVEVDAANYTKTGEPTIITLKKEYLKTLSVGSHSISIVSQYGQADTTFEVKGYTVEAESSEHGTVSYGDTDKTYAPGSTVTLTATPESAAYELREFYAYKKGDVNTTVAVSADGKITMPDFSIVVGGRFKDKDMPEIEGIKDGETYYTTQKFTVSDATSGIKEVKVNDTVVTDYTLAGDKAETYTIRATDNTGNFTEISVTMKPIASLADPIKDLNADNVLPGDKEDIQNVKEEISEVGITNATQEEIDALKKLDEKCDELLKVIEGYEKPEIIEGAGTEIQLDNLKDARFRSSAPFNQFVCVKVDGKELAVANYTKAEGSTIIVLKAEYLKTLSVGKHTLSVVSEYGSADTIFYIKDYPATGDNSNSLLWILLMAASAAAIAAGVGYSIKLRKDN